MTEYADLFERKVGVRLHPGSLNVVLDEPWTVEGAALRLEPPEYGVPMMPGAPPTPLPDGLVVGDPRQPAELRPRRSLGDCAR